MQEKDDSYEIINLSGSDGTPGSNGISGQQEYNFNFGQNGHNGAHGGNGLNGTNARNANFKLYTKDQTVYLKEIAGKIYYQFDLNQQKKVINIYAVGGNGGLGGDGGQGGNGNQGQNGKDATLKQEATNGQPGGNGGKGGNGGNGGNGGSGGDLNIQLKSEDMDLLMLIGEVNVKGGKGGKPGKGGKGGQGGVGGKGGNGLDIKQEFIEALSQDTTQVKTMREKHITNGKPGIRGFDGKVGNSGKSGNQGADGHFTYTINDNNYYSKYNVRISSTQVIAPDDGIFEPGKIIPISNIVLQNIGGMPTPTHQNLIVSVESNQHIICQPQNYIKVSKSINSNQTITIDNPLVIEIVNQNQPCLDSVFCKQISLKYHLCVSRIMEEFKHLEMPQDTLLIQYPVQGSKIKLCRSVKKQEETPLVIGLKNVSQADLGIASNSKRRLKVTITHRTDQEPVQFIPKQDEYFQQMHQFPIKAPDEPNRQVIWEQNIGLLKGKKEIIVSGTLKFTNPNINLYSQTNLQYNLYLEDKFNPNNAMKKIQTINFNLNVSEEFAYHQDSDFLLIVNSEVKKQQIEVWKLIANELGSNLDIWNISNYNGFKFSHVLERYGKSFSQLYKNKVLIIYNNEFVDNKSKNTNAIQMIGDKEISQAYHQNKISTYIIDKPQSQVAVSQLCKPLLFRKQLLPQFLTEQIGQWQLMHLNKSIYNKYQEWNLQKEDIIDFQNKDLFLGFLKENLNSKKKYLNNQQFAIHNFFKSYFFRGRTPIENDLRDEAATLSAQVSKLVVGNQFVILYEFQPIIQTQGFWKTVYSIGKIFVKFLNPLKTSLILHKSNLAIQEQFYHPEEQQEGVPYQIQLQEDIQQLQQFNPTLTQQKQIMAHKLCILKLLPFSKKLDYLVKNGNKMITNRKLILLAIASELLEEMLIYSENATSGLKSPFRLMDSWIQFTRFNFKDIIQVKSQQFIQLQIECADVFSRLILFIEHSKSFGQKILFLSKKTRLLNKCEQILWEKFGKEQLNIDNNLINAKIREHEQQQSKNNRQLLKKFLLNLEADILSEYSVFDSNFNLSSEENHLVLNKNQLPILPQNMSCIKESQYIFFDKMKGVELAENRQMMIEEFEKQIQYY